MTFSDQYIRHIFLCISAPVKFIQINNGMINPFCSNVSFIQIYSLHL